jgi:hypothetical protein
MGGRRYQAATYPHNTAKSLANKGFVLQFLMCDAHEKNKCMR